MGTNYYARPIKQIQAINDLKVLAEFDIRANSSTDLYDIIKEWAEMKIAQLEDIHIGKSSAGWRFLFNHNDWQYYTNINELKEWLKEYEIVSEYKEVISFEEFWQMVENKQKQESAIRKTDQPKWYIIQGEYEFSSSNSFC